MFKLLVLDTSYSFEAISNLGLEDSVTCRDLDGFFDHVWTVHPFGTLVTSSQWKNKYGRPDIYQLADAHTFIEGKMGLFRVFSKITFLNFLIGQIHIFFYLVNLVKKGIFHKHLRQICRSHDTKLHGTFGRNRLCN